MKPEVIKSLKNDVLPFYEDKGLIVSKRTGRQSLISLTEKGERVVQLLQKIVQEGVKW